VVGLAVGLAVGFGVGFGVGWSVGWSVGLAVGLAVGFGVGWSVGLAVGLTEGLGVGLKVGAWVSEHHCAFEQSFSQFHCDCEQWWSSGAGSSHPSAHQSLSECHKQQVPAGVAAACRRQSAATVLASDDMMVTGAEVWESSFGSRFSEKFENSENSDSDFLELSGTTESLQLNSATVILYWWVFGQMGYNSKCSAGSTRTRDLGWRNGAFCGVAKPLFAKRAYLWTTSRFPDNARATLNVEYIAPSPWGVRATNMALWSHFTFRRMRFPSARYSLSES